MKYTVLLLEDDISLSDTIKQFLTLKGYDVIVAYDGVMAQDLLYENSVDLMLLDVKVPKIDGFGVLQSQRKRGSDIPAIFITSLNSADDVARGFEYGCDDYIRKPFALKELLVRIEAQLKRRYNTHSDTIEINGYSFDPKEFTLQKNGQKISLKPKELKLLDLFVRHPDSLIEYKLIFDTLWEYDEEPSSGALRTYIKRLRAILGKETIETVKNIGYRFVTK
jgi:DNA-binding response OmpR family regulator